MTDTVDGRSGALLPAALYDTGVVAVLRADSLQRCEAAVGALIEQGIVCIELTMTIPGIIDEIGAFIRRFGNVAQIGVGTVTSARDLDHLASAGAKFVVTPVVAPDVIAAALARDLPVIAGALTPTEVFANWQSGASAVKVFPAASVGATYLEHLRGPFPDLPLVPSGGLSLESVAEWVRSGSIAVSLGGPLLGDALDGGDLSQLRDRARQTLIAVATARASR
ncbi:MAG: bifunctional 4-hydroxy-2-oxoglutarate aldolase/2-dehydro-3-deoxy-phosphogluconate aldolase [Microcella sp.]|uniref:bifunctional 4-hydroxy-2-oxoglutarate aldolase/2-dehydro-3-deoxy-phosphogluconate aldolase n=1 Tax=Microcella sp. TaxID=1913979 RepID=UPI003315AD09